MPSSAHLDAAVAWWSAAGGGPIPELPDNPADATAALLKARPFDSWACSFGRADVPDPWPTLAVGNDAWADVTWAIACADLTPAGSSSDGALLVIDRCPDPRGEHRAFFVTREGEATGPHFASTASLLEWATVLRETADDDDNDAQDLDRDAPPRDLWNRSALSGVGALAALKALSPSTFYRALRAGTWPETRLETGAPKAGDPVRANLLRTLVRFAKTRALTLPPDFDLSELNPAQRTLVERLRDLEGAAKKRAVPAYVTALTKHSDPKIAAAAKAWSTRSGAAPEAERSERFKAAYEAVDRCLTQLEAAGELEFEEGERPDLVEEVLDAMMKTSSGDRAVRAAVGVVMESAHVAEVFADDQRLVKAFRKALGG
jgi:hypothetical protein